MFPTDNVGANQVFDSKSELATSTKTQSISRLSLLLCDAAGKQTTGAREWKSEFALQSGYIAQRVLRHETNPSSTGQAGAPCQSPPFPASLLVAFCLSEIGRERHPSPISSGSPPKWTGRWKWWGCEGWLRGPVAQRVRASWRWGRRNDVGNRGQWVFLRDLFWLRAPSCASTHLSLCSLLPPRLPKLRRWGCAGREDCLLWLGEDRRLRDGGFKSL